MMKYYLTYQNNAWTLRKVSQNSNCRMTIVSRNLSNIFKHMNEFKKEA